MTGARRRRAARGAGSGRPLRSRLAVAVLACVGAGCGAAARRGAEPLPLPVGPGPAYMPPSLSEAVAAGRPVGGLRCTRSRAKRRGVFVELIAHRRVILIPGGIGIAPPRRATGAYVTGGRCTYPLVTHAPTGVVELERGSRATLGDLFSLWGQRLSRRTLAGFSGAVRVYAAGRPVAAAPRAVSLAPHTTIVVELGAYVPPHRSYAFPPGL